MFNGLKDYFSGIGNYLSGNNNQPVNLQQYSSPISPASKNSLPPVPQTLQMSVASPSDLGITGPQISKADPVEDLTMKIQNELSKQRVQNTGPIKVNNPLAGDIFKNSQYAQEPTRGTPSGFNPSDVPMFDFIASRLQPQIDAANENQKQGGTISPLPETGFEGGGFGGGGNYDISGSGLGGFNGYEDVIVQQEKQDKQQKMLDFLNSQSPFDADKYFQLSGRDDMTLQDLYQLQAHINNIRNDIAVGAIDPFGDMEGLAISPQERRQLQQSAANIYDVMLGDVAGKIQYQYDLAKNGKAGGIGGLEGSGFDFSQDINQYGVSNDQLASFGASLLSGGKRDSFLQGYQEAPDKHNFLRSYAIENLFSPTQNTDYRAAEQMLWRYKDIIAFIEEHGQKIPNGPYASTMEQWKKYLGKDQESLYTTLQTMLGEAQAEARVRITGVAMSKREEELWKMFNPDDKDTLGTMLDKLKARTEGIESFIERAPLLKLGLTTEQVNSFDTQKTQSTRADEVRQILKAQDWSDSEINETLESMGFSSVGGGTNTASMYPGVNRPQRNNNPLNIKASAFTSKFDGVAGYDSSPASDGGHFLIFNSPQEGFNAAVRLLQQGSPYKGKTVDQALKIWSNQGYGGEIVPSIANRQLASLSQQELNALVQHMAKREGYFA